MPVTVVEAERVFMPLPPKVRLLNAVVPVRVCAPPLKITVPAPEVKVPLFDQTPVIEIFAGLKGSMVKEAPD